MTGTINPPDFDDMMELSETIRELSLKEIGLKNKIKEEEAKVVIEATLSDEHLVNNKPPSMAFINSAWIFTGFNGEILELRSELAKVSSELDAVKRVFDLKRDMLEVWRTESANKRASVL